MAKYQRILLATDFCSDNADVIHRAADTAADHGAELWVVHVLEPLPAAYGPDATGTWAEQFVALQSELRSSAETMMADLRKRFDIPADHTRIVEGKASREIHTFASENNIDLIVLGTHGQHGLGLLLGSTANSVLHGIECDSLIVRIAA